MSKFKVGDKVRYINDGDEGIIADIDSWGEYTIDWEIDGEEGHYEDHDLELVEPAIKPKSKKEYLNLNK